jgi:predicted nucleotidyltransferase
MNDSFSILKHYPYKEHRAAFETLISVFREFQACHFLIGGQARDLFLSQQNIRPNSLTRDIDFAIMVADLGQFAQISKRLAEVGFEQTTVPHRIIWTATHTIIDLLPFGEVAKDEMVQLKTDMDLSVIGFLELSDELQSISFDETQSLSIQVAPLHGIFMLKLISWDEKRVLRTKDLRDLYQILMNYWDFVEQEAYDQHEDLFGTGNFSWETAGARILGRHLRTTLAKSEKLKTLVIRILEEQVALFDPPGPMLMKFADEKDQPVIEMKEVLDNVIQGIKDPFHVRE